MSPPETFFDGVGILVCVRVSVVRSMIIAPLKARHLEATRGEEQKSVFDLHISLTISNSCQRTTRQEGKAYDRVSRISTVREKTVVASSNTDTSSDVVEQEQHPGLPVVLAIDEPGHAKDRRDEQEERGDPVDLLEHISDNIARLGSILEQTLAYKFTSARFQEGEEVHFLETDRNRLSSRFLKVLEGLLKVVNGDHWVGRSHARLLEVVLSLGLGLRGEIDVKRSGEMVK